MEHTGAVQGCASFHTSLIWTEILVDFSQQHWISAWLKKKGLLEIDNFNFQSILAFFQLHFSLTSPTNLVSDSSARFTPLQRLRMATVLIMQLYSSGFVFMNSEEFVANQHYCVIGVSCWKKANILALDHSVTDTAGTNGTCARDWPCINVWR